MLVRRPLVAGLIGLVAKPVIVPPDPSGDPEQCDADGAAADGPPLAAAILIGAEYFPVRAERFRARRVLRPRVLRLWSIGNGYPAGDERESLRCALGTLLRIVNLVAIQTKAG